MEDQPFFNRNFDRSANQLRQYFDVDEIDVTVCCFSDGDAPISGIGGWAINEYRIEILLDASRQDLDTVIENEFPAVLAHEVNHIQLRLLKEPEETLAQNLI